MGKYCSLDTAQDIEYSTTQYRPELHSGTFLSLAAEHHRTHQELVLARASLIYHGRVDGFSVIAVDWVRQDVSWQGHPRPLTALTSAR
jgi:hypothetical protein